MVCENFGFAPEKKATIYVWDVFAPLFLKNWLIKTKGKNRVAGEEISVGKNVFFFNS